MLATLTAEWRRQAAVLRGWAALGQADVLERCADEVDAAVRAHALEELTLEQAAEESGFEYTTLQKQIGRGELENVGKKGRPRVRRGDLPRKARRHSETTPEVADVILGRRTG